MEGVDCSRGGGGGTVGQFGPLGCRINSTSTFVIFCIRVDVSRVTSGYGGDILKNINPYAIYNKC